MFLPVSDSEFNDSILTVLKVEPLMEFQEDADKAPVQQLHRKSRLPLWSVTASYEHEMDFEPENFQVRIASGDDPGITPGPIRFGGLAFRTWNMNGKKGLSITADTWTQEPAPSAKRAATAKPAPDTSTAKPSVPEGKA